MVAKTELYRAFGFLIRSQLALPELSVADVGSAVHQVDIRRGTLPDPENMAWLASGVAADADRFWMDVPDVARVLVRSGNDIVVDPAAGADERDVRLFLLGSAMGALLHQRGLLPLHASVVEVDGGAVAFMGTSGAGKSTVALHLVDQGHPMVSDDICAIEIKADGVAVVHPGPPRMKLCQRSLAATGRSAAALAPVPGVREKYQLAVARTTADRVLPLRAVILLDHGETGAVIRITGSAAVAALIANTFRGELVAPMERGRAHLDQCLTVARRPGVHRLTRAWSLDRLAENHATLQTWLSAGQTVQAAGKG